MSNLRDRCLAAVKKAYLAGVSSPTAPRKQEKVRILHGWLKQELRMTFPSDYTIHGKTNDQHDHHAREIKVDGKYYPKMVDLAVKRDGAVWGVVSVKFVLSSYQKNAINYFENQLGETANLRDNDIVYGNIIFFTEPIAVHKKGSESTFESLTDKSIGRYMKLTDDYNNSVVPNVQALVVACLNDDKTMITRLATRRDLPEVRDPASRDFLFRKATIDNFVEDFSLDTTRHYERRNQTATNAENTGSK